MTQIIALELNEVNFEFIEAYIARNDLPNFRRLLSEHGLIKTISEKEYPYLEPWIQWPTVYTGKTYSEHGIFRLGDAVDHQHVQIWEYLEGFGLKVGAVSPMNAVNRCESPAFFLPDPWTDTPVTADPSVARLYGVIKRLVNDNASDRRSVAATARELLPLAMRHLSLGSTGEYLRVLGHMVRHKWARAAILDRLLADLFLSLWQSAQPNYASLFLNAAAHLQHHHMYDAAIYDGERSNPGWYSSAADGSVDPLLLIYRTYDSIIGDLMALKNTRLFITTGLSQYPNEREHYQYRMTTPEATLSRAGLRDYQVQLLMSRDFLLAFTDPAAATMAASQLAKVQCRGENFFSVDCRGDTLFCQIHYHGDPSGLAEVTVGGATYDLSGEIVLVSIENGLHRTLGYHVDTALTAASANSLPPQPLATLFSKFAEAALQGIHSMERPAA
jgi:hypothetical protein